MKPKRFFSMITFGKAIAGTITGARPDAGVHVSLEFVGGESGGVNAPM